MTDKSTALGNCPVGTCGTVITPSVLQEILEYNCDTETFRWLDRSRRFFKGSQRLADGWNTKFAGKPAFCSP